jgi:hypothetical protein
MAIAAAKKPAPFARIALIQISTCHGLDFVVTDVTADKIYRFPVPKTGERATRARFVSGYGFSHTVQVTTWLGRQPLRSRQRLKAHIEWASYGTP